MAKDKKEKQTKNTNKLEEIITNDYFKKLINDFSIATEPLKNFLIKYEIFYEAREKNILYFDSFYNRIILQNYELIKEKIKPQAIKKHLQTIEDVKKKINYLENY